MSQSIPDVSIILVSWNTRELTLQCLRSLPAALGQYHADIWVVDNASSDDSVTAIHAEHPSVNVIANLTNVGFAAANNQAIRQSTGRYVLLLNTDTIPHPGSIARLIAFADIHPRAGLVGPMLLNPDGSYQGSFADQPSVLSELLSATGLGVRFFGHWYPNHGPRRARHIQSAGYIQGACMLARRSAVSNVGLLDEQYFMYSEEPDWCLRMFRAGWQIWYTPDARIIHYGGQSTRQRRHEMVVALYRSKVRFFAKHHGRLIAVWYCALLWTVLRLKYHIQRFTDQHSSTPASPAIRWCDIKPATGVSRA